MSKQTCGGHSRDSVRDNILRNLHDSQKQSDGIRHKCATCAYMFGYKKGLESREFDCPIAAANEFDYDSLPDSQAGAGRHKCCICAFQRGFEAGQEANRNNP